MNNALRRKHTHLNKVGSDHSQFIVKKRGSYDSDGAFLKRNSSEALSSSGMVSRKSLDFSVGGLLVVMYTVFAVSIRL